MKFAEIIQRNSWLSIELMFLQLYHKEIKNISGYETVFNNLKTLSPMDTDFSIVVSNEKDDFDNEEYVNVSGYNNHPEDNQDESPNSYSLVLTNWGEWLGMDMDEKSLSEFTEMEIISHCLYEMTFLDLIRKQFRKKWTKWKDLLTK